MATSTVTARISIPERMTLLSWNGVRALMADDAIRGMAILVNVHPRDATMPTTVHPLDGRSDCHISRQPPRRSARSRSLEFTTRHEFDAPEPSSCGFGRGQPHY